MKLSQFSKEYRKSPKLIFNKKLTPMRSYNVIYAFLNSRLPDYKLDFGHVVLGTVTRHVVTLTNTGWFNASFRAERQHLHQHGFYVELDPVKDFPGAPEHNILQFPVSFDPRGANLGLGEVDTIIPINVS